MTMALGCPCSNVPGRRIGQLGALPKSLGFGRLGLTANPFAVTRASVPPVVLSKTVANNVATAGQLMANGVQPTPQQAVSIIKTLIPPQAGFKPNLPAPPQSGPKASSNLGALGGRQYRSQLTGLSFGRAEIRRRGGLAGFGAGVNVGESAAAGAAIGTVVPGIGNAIGGAVGAIVGIVSGLFGHKQAVPKVTQADVTQAQTWVQQYTAVAGSVVGRNFSATAINDMITALAIMNPGFWGRPNSTSIDQSAVAAFPNEEFTRIRYFFQQLATVPVGGEVTLTDIPSLPGHGKTNLNVSYTFTSPGVNAPSYILGAYFAQYFYVMCTIYDSAADCAGHLTAPFPQMHCDILDYVRSSNPAWDCPQPNVVTGADVSIAAPTVTQEGSATVATATQTTLAPAAGAAAATVAAPVPSAPPTPTAAPTAPASTYQAPAAATAPIPIVTPNSIITPSAAFPSTVPAAVPTSAQAVSLTTGKPVSSVPGATGLFAPSKAGMSMLQIAAIALVGLPLLVGLSSPKKRGKTP